MDELVSIAFVLGSIAQLVVAVLLIIVLWYLIAILRKVRDITSRLERGSALLAEDVYEFRSAIRNESANFWSGVKSLLAKVPQAFGLSKKRTRKSKPEDSEETATDL